MIKIDFTKETITIFMINKSSIYDAVEYKLENFKFYNLLIICDILKN